MVQECVRVCMESHRETDGPDAQRERSRRLQWLCCLCTFISRAGKLQEPLVHKFISPAITSIAFLIYHTQHATDILRLLLRTCPDCVLYQGMLSHKFCSESFRSYG